MTSSRSKGTAAASVREVLYLAVAVICPSSRSIWLSEDPGAAEPRGLGRRQAAGLSAVSGRRFDAAPEAAAPASGGRAPARAQEAGRAECGLEPGLRGRPVS